MPDPISPVVGVPANFVPVYALAFGSIGSAATAVDPTHPLPTAETLTASGVTPLTGTTAASTLIGPFTPRLGRAINLTLTGSWSGSVQLQRSIDGGTTRQPVTAGGQPWATFTANCNEPIAEETEAGATYYLSVTLAGGTLGYRVAQ